ncbi:hypothetical protein Scep_012650 [Stephania cephalantha]|uniref:Uncharacterized protein n=1 Tax=Stephania cephalantha TaxID=152367 RepID=A0AAP0JFX8_9MAGN
MTKVVTQPLGTALTRSPHSSRDVVHASLRDRDILVVPGSAQALRFLAGDRSVRVPPARGGRHHGPSMGLALAWCPRHARRRALVMPPAMTKVVTQPLGTALTRSPHSSRDVVHASLRDRDSLVVPGSAKVLRVLAGARSVRVPPARGGRHHGPSMGLALAWCPRHARSGQGSYPTALLPLQPPGSITASTAWSIATCLGHFRTCLGHASSHDQGSYPTARNCLDSVSPLLKGRGPCFSTGQGQLCGAWVRPGASGASGARSFESHRLGVAGTMVGPWVLPWHGAQGMLEGPPCYRAYAAPRRDHISL